MGHSSHVCLAVEISSPGDPFYPDLSGRAPGVSDPLIVWDNNKAQINMDFPPTAGGGSDTKFGIVHNGELYPRDITVGLQVDPEEMCIRDRKQSGSTSKSCRRSPSIWRAPASQNSTGLRQCTFVSFTRMPGTMHLDARTVPRFGYFSGGPLGRDGSPVLYVMRSRDRDSIGMSTFPTC